MTGGTGADIFVIEPGRLSTDDDIIRDFTDGQDTIDLTAFTDITGFDDLTIRTDENGTMIRLLDHDGGTIRLENFNAENLDADNFTFYEPPEAAVDGI